MSVTYDDAKMKADQAIGVQQAAECVSVGSGSDSVASDDGRHSSIFGGMANLTNTIIGTGVLALPFAFAQVGWAIAIVLMAFALSAALFTIHLYAKCCHRVGGENTSYGGVFKEAYPRLGWVADVAVIFTCIGACISYLMVVGDLVPQFVQQVAGPSVAADSFLYSRYFWIGIVFAGLGAPLGCLPSLDKLKFTSTLAIVAVLYVMVTVFLFAIEPSAAFDPCLGHDPATCRGAVQAVVPDGLGVLRALPMYIFAFACQVNVPAIYNVIKTPSVRSIDHVGGGSLGLVGLVYLGFGLGGVLTYGNNVSANILTDYPITPVVSAARLMLAFVVSVSYPVLFHPTRDAFVNIVHQCLHAAGKGAVVAQPRGRGVRWVYWISTVALLLTTVGVAMGVTDLGLVFGIIGATSCTASSFIIPAATYLKMFVYNDVESDTEKGWAPVSTSRWAGAKKWVAWFLAVFGVIFMPVAVAVMFI